jgi:hypothetical protein
MAHAMASAREHGYWLVCDSLDNYYQPFAEALDRLNQSEEIIRVLGPRDQAAKLLCLGGRALHKFRKFTRHLPFYEPIEYSRFSWQEGDYFNLSDPGYVKKARTGLVTLDGWMFNDRPNVTKHRLWLRDNIAPNADTRDACAAYAAEARTRADVLVGVHVRRGDYAKYYGGEFFYDNATYKRWMTAVAAELEARGKSPLFILCSNENVELADFAPLRVQSGPGTAMRDLYTLAACDYIMGPPSSYSSWASFVGDGQLLVLRNRDLAASLEKFRYCDVFPASAEDYRVTG